MPIISLFGWTIHLSMKWTFWRLSIDEGLHERSSFYYKWIAPSHHLTALRRKSRFIGSQSGVWLVRFNGVYWISPIAERDIASAKRFERNKTWVRLPPISDFRLRIASGQVFGNITTVVVCRRLPNAPNAYRVGTIGMGHYNMYMEYRRSPNAPNAHRRKTLGCLIYNSCVIAICNLAIALSQWQIITWFLLRVCPESFIKSIYSFFLDMFGL